MSKIDNYNFSSSLSRISAILSTIFIVLFIWQTDIVSRSLPNESMQLQVTYDGERNHQSSGGKVVIYGLYAAEDRTCLAKPNDFIADKNWMTGQNNEFIYNVQQKGSLAWVGKVPSGRYYLLMRKDVDCGIITLECNGKDERHDLYHTYRRNSIIYVSHQRSVLNYIFEWMILGTLGILFYYPQVSIIRRGFLFKPTHVNFMAYSYIFGFCLLISTPALFMIFGIKYVSDDAFIKQERRRPNSLTREDLSPDKLKLLPSRIDSWFDDHFGLRRELIGLWAECLRPLDVTLHNNVVFGPDNYLHYRSSLHYLMDDDPALESKARKIVDAIEARHKWLHRRGVDFMFFASPLKATVYPDSAPEWARNSFADPNLLDLVMRECANRNLPALDLRPVLIEEKLNYGNLLYYKTDFHWTYLAGWIAYREVISKYYAKRYPTIKPLSLTDLSATYTPSEGSQAKWAKLNGRVSDFFGSMELQFDGDERINKLKLFDEEGNLLTKGGLYNTRNRYVSTESIAPRLLFIGDSFSDYMISLTSATFSETTHRTFNHIKFTEEAQEMTNLVHAFKPDIVLFQRVESEIEDFSTISPSWASPAFSPEEAHSAFAQINEPETTLDIGAINNYSREPGDNKESSEAITPSILDLDLAQYETGASTLLVRIDIEAARETNITYSYRQPFNMALISNTQRVEKGNSSVFLEIKPIEGDPSSHLCLKGSQSDYRVVNVVVKPCASNFILTN